MKSNDRHRAEHRIRKRILVRFLVPHELRTLQHGLRTLQHDLELDLKYELEFLSRTHQQLVLGDLRRRGVQLSSTSSEVAWLEEPKVFRWLSLVLPARLCKEDLGDAMEELAELVREGAPRWEYEAKVLSTCFWVGLNAAREVLSVLRGSGGGQ